MSRSVPLTAGATSAAIAIFAPPSLPSRDQERGQSPSSGAERAVEPEYIPPESVPWERPPLQLNTVSSGTLIGQILFESDLVNEYKIARDAYVRREYNWLLRDQEFTGRLRRAFTELPRLRRAPVPIPDGTSHAVAKRIRDVARSTHIASLPNLTDSLQSLKNEVENVKVESAKDQIWKKKYLAVIDFFQKVYRSSIEDEMKNLKERPSKNLILLSTYLQYSHSIIYRTNSIFNLRFIEFTLIGGQYSITNEPQVIHGNHPIFRPGGTHHLVYVDPSTEKFIDSLLDTFDIAVNGQIECEKDFDTDRSGSG